MFLIKRVHFYVKTGEVFIFAFTLLWVFRSLRVFLIKRVHFYVKIGEVFIFAFTLLWLFLREVRRPG